MNNFKGSALALVCVLLGSGAASARPVVGKQTFYKTGIVGSWDRKYVISDTSWKVRTRQIPAPVPPNPTAGADDLVTILNLFMKAFEVIKSNRAVVNTKTDFAAAYPEGAKKMTDMTNWSRRPKSFPYRLSVRNGWGVEAARADFAIYYMHSGRYQGRGAYLHNVTIRPRRVRAVWGFETELKVEFGEPVNVGSAEEPMAGMELFVTWTVDSKIMKQIETRAFFVTGDGGFGEVLPEGTLIAQN